MGFEISRSSEGHPRSVIAAPDVPADRRPLFWLQDRLAAQVGGAVDPDQHADAGVGADMLLLALGELCEDRVVDRSGLVQLRGAPEAQEAGVEHLVALRLEVR